MASRITLALAALLVLCAPSLAQDLPIDQQLPPRAAPTSKVEIGGLLPVLNEKPDFDAAKASQIYVTRLEGPAREKSDAYYEGGYGLKVIDLLYGLVVAGLLLFFQISARIRDWAQDRTHSRSYQTMLYAVITITTVTIATLPLTLYETYFREHAYGLSNLTLLQWAGDFATSFAVTLVTGVIVLPIFYAVIRATRESWWLWTAGLTILCLVLALVITPIAISPLFNHSSPLPAGPLKERILSLARANDIPADNVWVVDESRQSNRISANVSGFLGTTRISLNDNLLKQGTPDEVLAVVGHEMGHYVMDHATRQLLMFGLVIILGFGFVGWCFLRATELFGGNWQVRYPDDIAGLPLMMALLSIFLFFATPVTNAITRSAEAQADIFGVNAVRKPDAFASVVLKMSNYRKLDPSHLEEVLFYDHPSGRNRIRAMMDWKKEHVSDIDIRETVSSNPR